MPGPAPKDASVRARGPRASTRAKLCVDHDIVAPPLPDGFGWHPLTQAWWDGIWASPMAPEYADMDIHGLYRVAMLMNDFWLAETPKQRAELQVRLEKADADFGTNPLARRRLEWQIEATEDSKFKGKKRRAEDKPPVVPPLPGDDPRLKLVQ